MSSPIASIPGPGTPVQPAHDARTEKLRHAAAEFESLLVKQLLKASKMGGAEKANGYADMAIDAMATAVEHGGGLGLARRIEESIGAALHPGGGTGT